MGYFEGIIVFLLNWIFSLELHPNASFLLALTMLTTALSIVFVLVFRLFRRVATMRNLEIVLAFYVIISKSLIKFLGPKLKITLKIMIIMTNLMWRGCVVILKWLYKVLID